MTTSPGDHETLRERLGAHVLGGLDEDEHAALDAHLAGCADCRAERARIAPLAGPLRRLDPDALGRRAVPGPGAGAPTPAGFAAILGRLDADRALDASTVVGTSPTTSPPAAPDDPRVVALPRRRPARSRLLLAAAAVVIALAGLGTGFALAAGRTTTPADDATVVAAAPGVRASAGTIAHTWGVEVVLTADGFAAGQVYEVAVLDAAGRPVGAGAFVGTGATEMVCRLNASVLRDRATGFVVTDAAGDEVLRSRFV